MNAEKIQAALAVVHRTEKSLNSRARAVRDAIQITGLTEAEGEVLCRATHVTAEELAAQKPIVRLP